MEIQKNSKMENYRNFIIKRNTDTNRYSKKLFTLFIFCILINLTVSRKAKSHLVQEEEFPELSEEEITRAKQQYLSEEDIDQKGYLEPIIKPETFDLNKDRKISKEELKKAIRYCIYPKTSSKRKVLTDEFKTHVNNQIDLHVNGLDFESLNYRQFGKYMNRIVADDFINQEIMSYVHMIPKDYREIAHDL